MASKLTRIIAFLYKMQDSEIQALQDDLLRQMSRAWQKGITDEARRFGCPAARGNAPRGNDLADMKRLAKRDAESIGKTWNRDVERQVEKLYQANPRGNRQYYISNMQRWVEQRNAYKAPQIALMTETNIRQLARSRFWDENNITAGFKLVGPPPVCKVCSQLIARGTVSKAVKEKNEAPVHIGCTHEWNAVNTKPSRIPCQQMWIS